MAYFQTEGTLQVRRMLSGQWRVYRDDEPQSRPFRTAQDAIAFVEERRRRQ